MKSYNDSKGSVRFKRLVDAVFSLHTPWNFSENINVILVSFYMFSAPPIFMETDSQWATPSSFNKSCWQAFMSFAASHAELRRMNLSFLIYLKNIGKFVIYRVAQVTWTSIFNNSVLASGYFCPILCVCVYTYDCV